MTSQLLGLPNGAVRLAVQKTRQRLHEYKARKKETERLERLTEFRPHAIILTERSRPSPKFVAAAMGPEKILRIDFDVTGDPKTFVGLALDGLKRKLATRRDNKLPAFGGPTGIVLNYSPDFAVRFDLDGAAQEIFREAYRIGQADLLAHGRPVPAAHLVDSATCEVLGGRDE